MTLISQEHYLNTEYRAAPDAFCCNPRTDPYAFNGTPRKDAQKTLQKGSEKSSEKIIRAIMENPAVSAQELANMFALSSRAIEKHLSNLKEKGLLKRIGPDRGGHWEVVTQ
ncbi:MAG: winged helix-turn-helix transcriptional regulator [Candidatus Omnitrophota bacterium]|nr:winged helix-turn-helix transcriptional regulator [Candidatus Omnitrophota bacterium]